MSPFQPSIRGASIEVYNKHIYSQLLASPHNSKDWWLGRPKLHSDSCDMGRSMIPCFLSRLQIWLWRFGRNELGFSCLLCLEWRWDYGHNVLSCIMLPEVELACVSAIPKNEGICGLPDNDMIVLGMVKLSYSQRTRMHFMWQPYKIRFAVHVHLTPGQTSKIDTSLCFEQVRWSRARKERSLR